VNKNENVDKIELIIQKGDITFLEDLSPSEFKDSISKDKVNLDGKKITITDSSTFILHGESDKKIEIISASKGVRLAATDKCDQLVASMAYLVRKSQIEVIEQEFNPIDFLMELNLMLKKDILYSEIPTPCWIDKDPNNYIKDGTVSCFRLETPDTEEFQKILFEKLPDNFQTLLQKYKSEFNIEVDDVEEALDVIKAKLSERLFENLKPRISGRNREVFEQMAKFDEKNPPTHSQALDLMWIFTTEKIWRIEGVDEWLSFQDILNKYYEFTDFRFEITEERLPLIRKGLEIDATKLVPTLKAISKIDGKVVFTTYILPSREIGAKGQFYLPDDLNKEEIKYITKDVERLKNIGFIEVAEKLLQVKEIVESFETLFHESTHSVLYDTGYDEGIEAREIPTLEIPFYREGIGLEPEEAKNIYVSTLIEGITEEHSEIFMKKYNNGLREALGEDFGYGLFRGFRQTWLVDEGREYLFGSLIFEELRKRDPELLLKISNNELTPEVENFIDESFKNLREALSKMGIFEIDSRRELKFYFNMWEIKMKWIKSGGYEKIFIQSKIKEIKNNIRDLGYFLEDRKDYEKGAHIDGREYINTDEIRGRISRNFDEMSSILENIVKESVDFEEGVSKIKELFLKLKQDFEYLFSLNDWKTKLSLEHTILKSLNKNILELEAKEEPGGKVTTLKKDISSALEYGEDLKENIGFILESEEKKAKLIEDLERIEPILAEIRDGKISAEDAAPKIERIESTIKAALSEELMKETVDLSNVLMGLEKIRLRPRYRLESVEFLSENKEKLNRLEQIKNNNVALSAFFEILNNAKNSHFEGKISEYLYNFKEAAKKATEFMKEKLSEALSWKYLGKTGLAAVPFAVAEIFVELGEENGILWTIYLGYTLEIVGLGFLLSIWATALAPALLVGLSSIFYGFVLEGLVTMLVSVVMTLAGLIVFAVVLAVLTYALRPLISLLFMKILTSIHPPQLLFSSERVKRYSDVSFVISNAPDLSGSLDDTVAVEFLVDGEEVTKSSCRTTISSSGEIVCVGEFLADIEEGKHKIKAGFTVKYEPLQGLTLSDEETSLPSWFADLVDSVEEAYRKGSSEVSFLKGSKGYALEFKNKETCIQAVELATSVGEDNIYWKEKCRGFDYDVKGDGIFVGPLAYGGATIKMKFERVGDLVEVSGCREYMSRYMDTPGSPCQPGSIYMGFVTRKHTTSAAELTVLPEEPKFLLKFRLKTDKGSFESLPFSWTEKKVLEKGEFVELR
jgi:hypothetical protein